MPHSIKSLNVLINALTILTWIYPLLILVGSYYVLVFSHDYNLPDIVGLLAIPILFVGKPFIQSIRESYQLKLNHVNAFSDARNFFLILRSFTKTDLQQQVLPKGRTADVESLLEYVEDAIHLLGGVLLYRGNIEFSKNVRR